MSREPGDTDVRVIAELDDGTQIQHIKEYVEEKSSQGDYTYLGYERKIAIVPPEGDPIEIEPGPGHGINPTRWRERVIKRLIERVDEFQITDDPNTVPVNIIDEGKPAVVSYLYAIHGWSYWELHEELDLTGGTIGQYIMGVANDNR